MIQEENNYLRDTMQDADLHELFPEFNKEDEWMQLSGKLKSANKPVIHSVFSLLKIAAMLLLFIGAGIYIWYGSSLVKVQTNNFVVSPQLKPEVSNTTVIDTTDRVVPDNKPAKAVLVNIKRKVVRPAINRPVAAAVKITEPICNATKCAIEICIYQTVHCGNGVPSEIADCRTIEPDQSGQLNYKAPENMGKNCRVTIDEIRIKKVSTGETIVINGGTEPASAQEMFQCFTGETRCDILAGIFTTGCNDDKPRQLKIGSHFGDIIIQ